jgi:hypothetical protein
MRIVMVAAAVLLAGNGALASDPQLEGESLRKAISGKTVSLDTPRVDCQSVIALTAQCRDAQGPLPPIQARRGIAGGGGLLPTNSASAGTTGWAAVRIASGCVSRASASTGRAATASAAWPRLQGNEAPAPSFADS